MLAKNEDHRSLWPRVGLFHLLLFVGYKDDGTKISFDQSSHHQWKRSQANSSIIPFLTFSWTFFLVLLSDGVWKFHHNYLFLLRVNHYHVWFARCHRCLFFSILDCSSGHLTSLTSSCLTFLYTLPVCTCRCLYISGAHLPRRPAYLIAST